MSPEMHQALELAVNQYASHNWEVRDVNVLLYELEKFDGVYILSTNRNVQLDKALALVVQTTAFRRIPFSRLLAGSSHQLQLVGVHCRDGSFICPT